MNKIIIRSRSFLPFFFSLALFNLESHAYLLVICYFERSQCLFCSFGHNKRFAQTNDQKIGMRYELRVGIIICLRLGNLFWIQKKIAGVNRLLFPEAHVWLRSHGILILPMLSAKRWEPILKWERNQTRHSHTSITSGVSMWKESFGPWALNPKRGYRSQGEETSVTSSFLQLYSICLFFEEVTDSPYVTKEKWRLLTKDSPYDTGTFTSDEIRSS